MYILLRLKSPLQSWGDNSKNETSGAYRGTYVSPSDSAIIGLICACMGINRIRNKAEYEKVVDSIKFENIYFNKEPTILKDYQTMGGGYNMHTYEKNMVPVNIDGKTNEVGDFSNAKLSVREYLADADFFTELLVENIICDNMISKLENPIWFPYFGRASNIPSTKIFVGSFNTHEECVNFINRR